MKKICETSDGPFYFVLDGKKLFHISKYAVRKESNYYYIDSERLKEKPIVIFTMPVGYTFLR